MILANQQRLDTYFVSDCVTNVSMHCWKYFVLTNVSSFNLRKQKSRETYNIYICSFHLAIALFDYVFLLASWQNLRTSFSVELPPCSRFFLISFVSTNYLDMSQWLHSPSCTCIQRNRVCMYREWWVSCRGDTPWLQRLFWVCWWWYCCGYHCYKGGRHPTFLLVWFLLCCSFFFSFFNLCVFVTDLLFDDWIV